jgi:beta-N-acetylhexosaminidase
MIAAAPAVTVAPLDQTLTSAPLDSTSLGRLLMVDIPGPSLDPATREHLARYRPGGIILFRKNIIDREQTRALVADLRALLGQALLVAIDQEGGGVWRTSDLPAAPSAMSLGASNDPVLAEQVGAMIGRGLRSMGINWNFAPVLDVNNNPDNPVIAERSFGEDPALVARLATCGKHFPGHGDTSLDSHLALPSVAHPPERLQAVELAPFAALAAQGIPSIMTSHIVFPAYDHLPATLSRRLLTGLLRQQLGFAGVIVTDSMGMKAIDDHWGRGEALVLALQAGADLVEALGSQAEQAASFQALAEAGAAGLFDAAQLQASLARLAALAAQFPGTPLAYDPATEAADRQLAQAAWGRGLTAYRDPVLPAPGSAITLLVADVVPGENVAELGISGAALAERLGQVYQVKPIFHPIYQPELAQAAVQAAQAAGETIVYASTSRLRLRPATQALVAEAAPALHLALWNPYAVLDVKAPAIIGFGYRGGAIEALLAVLRGEQVLSGHSPITL